MELGVEVDESETAASQDLVEQLLHHQVVVWATSYRPDCGWIDLPSLTTPGSSFTASLTQQAKLSPKHQI